MQYTPHPKRAFSLIELSIAIVIIGLLVGGVLVARDLIAASEIRQVISTVERYKTAINSFRDKYMNLPGDLPDQSHWWPDECAAVNTDWTRPCSGNGDGDISRTPGPAPIYNEQVLALNNLIWAGFIDGPIRDASGLPPAAFYAHPILDSENSAIYIARPGQSINAHWYTDFKPNVHSLWIGGRHENNWLQGGVLAPMEAHRIDEKIDDGKPRTGPVHSEHTITSDPARLNCLNTGKTEFNFDYEQRMDGCSIRINLGF